MILKTVTQTCMGCPSQWSGKLDDGTELYVRYRWGWLTASVEGPAGEQILSRQIGDQFDGVISWDEVVPHIEQCGIDCSETAIDYE